MFFKRAGSREYFLSVHKKNHQRRVYISFSCLYEIKTNIIWYQSYLRNTSYRYIKSKRQEKYTCAFLSHHIIYLSKETDETHNKQVTLVVQLAWPSTECSIHRKKIGPLRNPPKWFHRFQKGFKSVQMSKETNIQIYETLKGSSSGHTCGTSSAKPF